MLKGILFDIDGTLVLSNDAHAKSWQEAFKEFGYEVEVADVLKLIGMGSDKLITKLFPKLCDTQGDGKIIKERRKEILLQKYLPTLQAAPGSRRLVESVQNKGLATVVASSAGQEELGSLLKAAKVEDLLTDTTTSDDAENSKPDPDIIKVALDKTGLRPDEVVMLGDTPYDIEAAGRAGIRCVAVRCGGWGDDDLSGASVIYNDPADILKQYLKTNDFQMLFSNLS